MLYRLLIIALSLMFILSATQNAAAPLVNLDHLRHLTEIIRDNGEDFALTHIYSEYPDYGRVDAAGEGIAAVDDIARAAIVYLWQYEYTKESQLLDLARASLNFVMRMQADNGEFYNFVLDHDMRINETGNTSRKSLGWWAMRALWALGEGIRVFDPIDPDYANRLAEAYLKTEEALGKTLHNYGETTSLHGFEIPAWIPGGESTVASIGMLGLSAYYQARPNERTADILTKIADGIAAYRLGDHHTYPFGMHPARANTPGFHHTWGAHMTHALTVAGMTLGREDWIASAAASADSFLLRQLAFERWRHIGVIPDRLNQIAYGTNMLVQTYAALYRATGAERYARYAGLAASWYSGNNMAGVAMYDPQTGRVFDGIDGPVEWRVNRNAGAESTIEGLMSLIAIQAIPQARELLEVKEINARRYHILQAEDGQRVVGAPAYFTGDWTGAGYISAGRYIGIHEGQRLRLFFELEQEGDYLLYVAHMRQSPDQDIPSIPSIENPPVIDGNADDWDESLPTLTSDSSQQFLRGAGLWRGKEVDSHSVQLSWDNENLYILATVRDPEHNQPYTLNAAWQGDALWIYMTDNPDARRLSAKFTLAFTPDGEQVWDWVNVGFIAGAKMVWSPLPDGDGYLYEAAIPWASLKIKPEPGKQIGFEAGRGIGGNSFMNLTGRDPDVATNLLTMMLADQNTPLTQLSAPRIALSAQLDDLEPFILEETVSPDTDYFWLDLLTPQPVHLSAGQHVLRYAYAGEEAQGANPGVSKVDAFYLQPAVARRQFQHPDGRIFTLIYDTLTGEALWEESS